jgi:hypothetical protein
MFLKNLVSRAVVYICTILINIIILTIEYGKTSITPGCIRKIPLNPPLQKGEAIGMPGLI